MAEEVDIIKHLLEIEAEATQMLLDAQKKADEKITSARLQVEDQFRTEYAKISATLDSEEKQKKKALTEKKDAEIEEYKQYLNSIQKNYEAFNQAVKNLVNL